MGFFLALVVGVALLILGYTIFPKPKTTKPEQMSEMDSPTAEAGKPIPVLFGEMLIKVQTTYGGVISILSKSSEKVRKSEYITLKDVQRAGYCMKGAKEWCALNNYDWRVMVHEGYPLEEARMLHDSIADHIIRVKESE